jgi:ribosomal protein L30E
LGEAKSTITGQASNHQVIDSSSITWIYNTDTADPGIVNGRPYTCWVTAVNDNGTADTSDDLESSPSFDYVATPSATPPPFAPVLTTATTGSSSSQQVILAWNAPVSSTGTVTYTVYYGTAKGVTNNTGVQADVGDATAVSVNNLTSGVKYYFVVTATDDNGQSAISNEESAVAY